MASGGGGSSGVQTQLTFDNVKTTLTADQTDETIPATGEADSTHMICDTVIGSTDKFQISSDSGTTYDSMQAVNTVSEAFAGGNRAPQFMVTGNSTGRYQILASNDAGSRIFQQMTTTEKEE